MTPRERWAVVVLALVTVAFRLHFFDWPPNRDVTTYATIAHELAHGESLYSDIVWDRKPPAIYATYLLAETLIGPKPLRLFVLGLVPALVLLALLVHAGNAYRSAARTGLLCGLTFTLLAGDLTLQMPDANTESFINVGLVAAFVVVLALRREHSFWMPVAAGTLFAAATLFKPVALPVAAALGAAHVGVPHRDCTRRAALSQVATMAATGALIWTATIGYFAMTGRLQVFIDTMLGSNADYAGDLLHNIWAGLSLAPILGEGSPLGWIACILPWVVALAVIAAHPGRRREWLLLAAYGFAALLAVAVPGRFYAHYFQLLLPPVLIGAAWLASSALAGSDRRKRRTRLAVIATLAGLIVLEARHYRGGPEDLLPGTYAELYAVTQRLGRRLGAEMKPDEALFQWGVESGLYFYSDKRPPAAIMAWPLVRGPQAASLSRAALERLTARPPDLIVVPRYFERVGRDHPIDRWIRSSYRPVDPEDPAERKFFVLFVPPGTGGGS